MSRQQKFEQAYAEAHGMPVETFETYRMGDTYRLPGIAKCWRFWNMAWDACLDASQATMVDGYFVVGGDSQTIELSELPGPICFENGPFHHRENIIGMAVKAGLKVKP